MAYQMEEWYLKLKNQYGLAPLSIGIGVIVIVLTTCLYCCCCGVKKQKKSSVFGKIREVTLHSGGGKKKSFWIDPFRPSNLEYQRRFEDEITRFLYLVGVDIAQPLFDYYNITFMDAEGKILGDNQKHNYLLDYRWILKHIAYNCRDYALILTKNRDRQIREKVIQLKDPGLTVQDILEDLQASKERSDPEMIASLACRIKDLCHSLKDRANKRAHGSHLREELEEETSSRGREAIMTMMNEGLQLIELIKTALPTTPKSLKDHYQNLVSMERFFREEFLLYVDVSRSNKRRFTKLESERKREVIQEALEYVLEHGRDDILDVMAVAVLPRFNYSIKQ